MQRARLYAHPDHVNTHVPLGKVSHEPPCFGAERHEENTAKAIISCAVTGSIHTPSMSPCLFDAFKFDWERRYLAKTKDIIMSNTFTQIEKGMTELGARGTRFEFECYDTNHLYNLAYFVDRGLIKPPSFSAS